VQPVAWKGSFAGSRAGLDKVEGRGDILSMVGIKSWSVSP